jgi:hypothetical protein
MSRSFRKTKIFGITTCESEKKDKRIANRKFRRKSKAAVKEGAEPPHDLAEVSSTWDFGKDGKMYWPNAIKRDMTK